jgi:hypothetical protein
MEERSKSLSRLKWLFWLLLLFFVLAFAFFVRKRPDGLKELIGRLRLRELESSETYHRVKEQDLSTRSLITENMKEVERLQDRARVYGAEAERLVRERKKIVEEVSSEIEDSERARRFNERYGFTDPGSGG